MRILLVEDNADDAALTRRAVQRAVPEAEIELARDGKEAVTRLLAPPTSALKHPQLVLLDMKLPRLDGLQVLRQVRQHPGTASLPVVMLTSSDDALDITDSYRAGVNSYLWKPIDFDDYMYEVGNAAKYWLRSNLYPPSD